MLPLFAKAQTQQQKSDSLHHALRTAANDTVKMTILTLLASHHVESNRDSALLYIEQALDMSKKIKQPLWTASALLDKAYILQRNGNLPLVFKVVNEAMAISKEAKNEKNVYIEEDSKSKGDPHKYRLGILAGGFHQLGNMYSQAGNKEKAIWSWKEEIRIAEEIKDETYLVNSNMNLGSMYLRLNLLDSARLYSNKAIYYSNSTGYKTYQGVMLKTIGDIFYESKQLDSAKYYYWKSLNVSRKQSNFSGEIGTHISLAQLYQSVFQTDSMLYYANAAYKTAKNLKVGTQIATSAELISNAFRQKGNIDSALTYLSISKTIGDSLSKVRNEKLTEFQNIGFEEQMRLEKTAQESVANKNKIRTIALFTGLGLLSILAFVFYRNNRQKHKANAVLEKTLDNLKSTQSQLIQSEKMASLGELTAGIAHEIQNPLNFVNNFSEINKELLVEMKDEIDKGNINDAKEIANDVIANEEKINYHGKRADSIVKGMLQHSRSSSGVKEPTDLNALCDEYLRLSYHGLRAKDKSFNATIKTDFDASIEKIIIMPQDFGRVVLNLLTNAFYAVDEKKKNLQNQNGSTENNYEPTVTIATKKQNERVIITVADNGKGMPQNVIEKIFQPFFTTKPTGKGTGLGLSMSYDIITKGHNGELKVTSTENEGTVFSIILLNQKL